ncbi:MAG: bifunctional glutamate N-acetyltransferase/amino-acid acetyltransferase ArgJ [Candidatus Eremiobacteraeota bacterium]|nr:bifunctional glutamate N-acetyltransferase/amino-acid acetyltransferase ArgJ [Candidatus Eremiobacteraeota bacterium]MCW5865840.1 bifunctional glutamate N-acetyltransferase/amino-acid acetyltransferase ArgJ [Candidatus Eremiobacteraeota bacterium]
MMFPQGFSAQVARCGLKPNGDPELAVVRSDLPCKAAGVFTNNRVAAAPVRYCRQLLARANDRVTAVVINSKNANAVTGPQGDRDCARLAALVDSGDVLTMSTGVIGQPMPMAAYEQGLRELQPAAAELLARAMMTTDTHPKVVVREHEGTRWLGVAKGAGMIHPDMATLLALVVTDADLPAAELQQALREANEVSFQSITVDGDTSTNDTLLVLANGASGRAPAGWARVLQEVVIELARMVAFDGEGARHRVTLHVSGLGSDAEARALGRVVLTSPLVKTAIAGKDANWGRILAAAGRSGVPFEPQQAALWWNGLKLLEEGAPTNPGAAAEAEAVEGSQVELRLVLGQGPGQATVWSCDLTHEYVSINGDYRT